MPIERDDGLPILKYKSVHIKADELLLKMINGDGLKQDSLKLPFCFKADYSPKKQIIMKKRLSLLTVFTIAITALVNGQAKLVEKVTKQGSEIVIPYEKYVLPNGLTLIVHEDHSDPVVHVDVTYHVGSAREE